MLSASDISTGNQQQQQQENIEQQNNSAHKKTENKYVVAIYWVFIVH